MMGRMHHVPLDEDPVETEERRDREFDRRRHAWDTAKGMVDQLLEQYELEIHRAVPTPVFVAPGLVSKAEQYCDLVLETADWLLGNTD